MTNKEFFIQTWQSEMQLKEYRRIKANGITGAMQNAAVRLKF